MVSREEVNMSLRAFTLSQLSSVYIGYSSTTVSRDALIERALIFILNAVVAFVETLKELHGDERLTPELQAHVKILVHA